MNTTHKELTVTLSQGTIKENFSIAILVPTGDQVQPGGGVNFSARVVRKLLQRGANNVLSLDSSKLAISKGKRFKLGLTFEGIKISEREFFYNSSDAQKKRFNKGLDAVLNACIMDIKDIVS